jgi:NAD(P)H-dependent flavin oxidoreductase YrpB (nitropropane dioxygenase family)
VDLLDRLSLDVPVGQAGMGGGLAGPELAVAVAAAGGLGTLGLAPANELRDSIRHVRDGASGRAVAVNLLTPFLRRSHVSVCVDSRIDVAVVAFGGERALVEELTGAGIFVFVMVGTDGQARRAVHWGAHGLIAQAVKQAATSAARPKRCSFCHARWRSPTEGRYCLLAASPRETTPARRWRWGPAG